MKIFALAAAVAALSATMGGFGSGVASAQTAPSTVEGDHDESLSTKLNKSDGVITPKADVDPGIHARAPDPHPNSTPVVPPSATGGGTAK